MQEGVFSGRGLFFTLKQIHWRCSKAHWCEETERETTIFHDLGRSENRWGRYGELQVAFPPTTLLVDPQFFNRLLSVYTFRRLTFEGDALNAIAGISPAITEHTGVHFSWGLPQQEFSLALAWSLGNRGPMLIRNQDYRRNQAIHQVRLQSETVVNVPFPTWSWAGWKMGYCVSWNRERTYSKNSISLNELHPEITFYHYEEDGRLGRISEYTANGKRSYFVNRLNILDQYSESRVRWMQFPNTIEALRQLNIGDLIVNPVYLSQLVF